MINSLLNELESLNIIEVMPLIKKYRDMLDKQPFVIDLPKYKITCKGYWESKCYGVIFVKSEYDKDLLYNALIEQDDYWEGSSDLIQVLPNEIDDFNPGKYTDYVGKTDIYNIDLLKKNMLEKGVEFIIYQEIWN